MPSTSERINCRTLICESGGSNKQYTIWIERKGGGFIVRTQWGPRGGWLQEGDKTKAPVNEDKARTILDKTIQEKIAKGYEFSGDAPEFVSTKEASTEKGEKIVHTKSGDKVDTGIYPMLLTPADESELERYIKDDEWVAQQKFNGKRIILKVEDGEVTGVNRRGLACPIPKELVTQVSNLSSCTFDGELVGTTYYAFDILEVTIKNKKTDLRSFPLSHRNDTLRQWVDLILKSSVVIRATLACTSAQKRALVKRLKAEQKEGVVFKRADAPYETGRTNDLQKANAIKIKFWKEGNFIIIAWTDKNSVELGAKDGKKIVCVGKLTVHEKYASQIKPGCIARVKYLYATDAGILYQSNLDPTDDGVVTRDDLTEKDCQLSQLQFEGKD